MRLWRTTQRGVWGHSEWRDGDRPTRFRLMSFGKRERRWPVLASFWRPNRGGRDELIWQF